MNNTSSTAGLLDPELQEQIDQLFEKFSNELKVRTVKLVSKHYTKLMKEKSKQQTSSVSKAVGGKATTSQQNVSKTTIKRHQTRTYRDESSDDNSDYDSE